jgi:hypothetical protein
MPKNSVFTVKVESELREAFIAEAAAVHRPASQLVRDFIAERRDAREHDAWFRGQVEEGVQQADDAVVKRTPHDQIRSDWQTSRADELPDVRPG